MAFAMATATTKVTRVASKGASTGKRQKIVRAPLFKTSEMKEGWIAGKKSLPSTLNEYEIIKTLGAGAHGIVQLVEFGEKQYALKSSNASDVDAVRELSTWVSLQNVSCVKGIVPTLHTVFYQQKQIHVLMDLMPGRELLEIMMDGLLLPQHEQAVCLLLIDTVRKLHTCGVVHMDIKPENMIVSSVDDDVIMSLVDYGGSCLDGEECIAAGTLYYMSPAVFERYKNEGTEIKNPPIEDWFAWGVSADIWSTALTCYTILCKSMSNTIVHNKWQGVADNSSSAQANQIARHLNSLFGDQMDDLEWLVKIVSKIVR